MDEEGVSNVYVQLGNDFNEAVAAFSAFNIDMMYVLNPRTFFLFTQSDALHRELLSVPDDLRNVLEQCLAEDATPDNLDLYLPNVRQIITNLLQGLRGKQSIYRRIVSDHRRRSGDQNHQRTDSRTSRTTNGSTRGDGQYTSQSSRPQTDDERESGSVSRRSGQSSRRRDQLSGHSHSSNQQNGNNVGVFAPTIVEHPVSEESSNTNTQPSQSSENPGSQRASDMSSIEASSSSRTSTPSQLVKEYSPSSSRHELPIDQEQNIQQAPSPPPPVPASVKRYSLVDKPASVTPTVVVDPSSPIQDQTDASLSPPPPLETPPVDPPPAVALSLAALKSNDVILERRASKRFSVYNISKMTGASTSRERSVRGHNHVNRRSVVASAANLTPNDLAVLTEDDEEAESPQELSSSGRRQRSRSRSIVPDTELPQVPGLPTAPESTYDAGDSSSGRSHSLSDSSQITVFLQLGREVKKVKIESGLTFSSLRVLFVDRFSYNPGLENFPAIYIRDPSSGVQYELENTDEVQEKCLLSLNIERAYSYSFISRRSTYFLPFCSSGSNQATH
jgi:Actin interacting protein 3